MGTGSISLLASTLAYAKSLPVPLFFQHKHNVCVVCLENSARKFNHKMLIGKSISIIAIRYFESLKRKANVSRKLPFFTCTLRTEFVRILEF